MMKRSTEPTLTEVIMRLEQMQENLERFAGYPEIRTVISKTYSEYVEHLDHLQLKAFSDKYNVWKLDYDRRYPIDTTKRKINLIEGNTIHSGNDEYMGI